MPSDINNAQREGATLGQRDRIGNFADDDDDGPEGAFRLARTRGLDALWFDNSYRWVKMYYIERQ